LQIHRITLSNGTYGVVCYFYDLSEQKRMEATVRASETLYRAIARNIPGGGVYVVDNDFRYLIAEGPVTEAFGLTREMLEGHITEVFPGEQGIRMQGRLKQNFAGETVSFETEHKGRVYWTQQAPLQDSIGQVIILTLDITERKQTEEALRQSEERFARFMHHLPGLAWIKDMQGRYLYANAAAEQAFNTPREKLYGRMDEDIFHPDVAAQFRRNDEQALTDEKGVQVIETLKHADGILHSSLVSKFPIPGPDGSTTLIGGTAFDITERLKAEEALRESEERFSAILRQATAGIVRKDAEGRLLFVNQAFCNMLGYTELDLTGKTVWEFIHPDDVAENKRSYDRLMLEGIPFKLERRLLRQDGSVIWVDASVSPIMDVTGKPQSAVAVEVDITGRRQAEAALQQLNLQLEDRVLSRTAKLRAVNQALRDEIVERNKAEEALRKSEAAARANEEKLSTLFELLPVGISFLDPEGRIIQMNPALSNILRLSKEQLLNQAYTSRKYIRANGTPMSTAEFASRRALMEGKTVYNVETGVILEDGEVIWTSVSAAPVDVADVGAVVVTVDITESKRAERALQESRERLQILSQRLVEVQEDERRAIARELHDRVGQTLAALNINLIIISGQLTEKVEEQISTRLNDSMKLVAETISLVRDVMSNLRPSVLDDYGLEAAIESHLSQFRSRYEIRVKFDEPEPSVPRLGPSIEMTFLRIAQEALMNIARHAHATEVNLSLWHEDNAICMTVQDNGTGIESWQDANRPGSHGLTIMRERAEAFGGNLKVSSVPGKGTKVEVKIPVETNDPSQAQKEKSQ
jgi:PAS domain S-box-containing protein